MSCFPLKHFKMTWSLTWLYTPTVCSSTEYGNHKPMQSSAEGKQKETILPRHLWLHPTWWKMLGIELNTWHQLKSPQHFLRSKEPLPKGQTWPMHITVTQPGNQTDKMCTEDSVVRVWFSFWMGRPWMLKDRGLLWAIRSDLSTSPWFPPCYCSQYRKLNCERNPFTSAISLSPQNSFVSLSEVFSAVVIFKAETLSLQNWPSNIPVKDLP